MTATDDLGRQAIA